MEAVSAHEIAPKEIEWGPPIGEGAYGKVYKGKCRGMDVALKVVADGRLDARKQKVIHPCVQQLKNVQGVRR
jgi:hypothetical protein